MLRNSEIYALLDPVLGVRYIGQSYNAAKRFAWHKSAARRGEKGRVYNWLRKVFRNGEEPSLIVLERVTSSLADDLERHWIRYFLDLGYDLTNCTEGGGGLSGWHHSDGAKSRIGNAHRGKLVTSQTRARLSRANLGKVMSLEVRRKISESSLGRQISTKTRQSIAARMRGNKHALGKTFTRRPETVLHGERSPAAKLTNKQAEEVRSLFLNGLKQSEIADKLKLDRVTVHRVVRGKTYKTD